MGLYDEETAFRQKTSHADFAQRAADMAGAVKDEGQNWRVSAGETARAVPTQIADNYTSVAEGEASQTLHDDRAAAREASASDRYRRVAGRAGIYAPGGCHARPGKPVPQKAITGE
jgi:hypothetical protein